MGVVFVSELESELESGTCDIFEASRLKMTVKRARSVNELDDLHVSFFWTVRWNFFRTLKDSLFSNGAQTSENNTICRGLTQTKLKINFYQCAKVQGVFLISKLKSGVNVFCVVSIFHPFAGCNFGFEIGGSDSTSSTCSCRVHQLLT